MNTDKIESSKSKLETLNDSDGEFYDAPQDIIQNQDDNDEDNIVLDDEDDEEEEKRIQENLLKKLSEENQNNDNNHDFDSTTPAFKNIDSKFQNLKLNKEEDEEKFVPLHERLNKNMQSNVNQEDNDDEETETVKKPQEIDPFFIDEELLQSEQDKLTDEEKEQKLAESQNLKQLGNDEFKNEDYQKALDLYTQALRVCPLKYQKERSVFYSNRSACYFKLKENEKCVKECSKSIELDPSFVKPLLRRAECNVIIDKLDEALEDYKKLSELEPRNMSHTHKCYELEQKIKERNEKLKDEMFGKLKELGNMVLKPFGLSTNNFQFVQDPNTGSYSVNFNK